MSLSVGLIGAPIFGVVGFFVGGWMFRIACWRNGFGLNFIFVGFGLLAVAMLVISIWRHT